jgi:hypothetical protein
MYSHAFQGCSKLTTIDLSNCEYIGGNTFEGCSSLRNIGNLKKIKGLGEMVFKECSSLEIDVNMPDYGNISDGDPHASYRNSDYNDARTFFSIGMFCGSGIKSISNLGSVCSKI